MNIALTEHEECSYDVIEPTGITLWDFPNKSDKETYLGLTSDCRHQTIQAGYYIGLTWLKEGEHSVSVTPKIPIDYVRMFMHCFYQEDDDIQEKLMKIYSIDFEKPYIPVENTSLELTPFIIVHFLQLVKQMLRKGMKRDYIFQEENLKGKMKGKLVFSRHFKKNILMKRDDRAYCRYQEYSEDCIENQIIKKALRFAEHFLSNYDVACADDLRPVVKSLLVSFENVSDITNIQSIKQFRINPLYKEYARTLKVAKLILRRFSYDIHRSNGEADKLLPSFWIDMPLLYEIYVLSLLRERFGDDVSYHLRTNKDEIDFGKRDEMLIMDAKYVPAWKEEIRTEHIEQLSRYARSLGIRRKLLGVEDADSIFNCLLLYPDENGIEAFAEGSVLQENGVEEIEYLKFYKLGIHLPQRE